MRSFFWVKDWTDAKEKLFCRKVFTLFTHTIYDININALIGDQLACDSSLLFAPSEYSSLTAQKSGLSRFSGFGWLRYSDLVGHIQAES